MARPLLVALIVLGAASAAAAQTPLSLDEAIALALAGNRTLQSATLEIAKAEQQVADARSRRYPVFSVETQAAQLLTPVSVTFPAGAFGDYSGTGPIPAADTKVTTPRRVSLYLSAQATQPLSQLFALNLGVKLSAAGVSLAAESVRATRLAVVHNVRRQYYAVQQTASELESADYAIDLLQQVSRDVANRVLQRVALKADGLDVEMRLARAELTRVTLQHTLDSQKEQLNLLLGRDLRTPFDVQTVPPLSPVSFDLAAAQARALAVRPDVRQSRLRLEQADLARRVAQADRLPDVGLALSYLSPLTIEGAPTNIASLGLQLRWEPFDWGRKERAVATRRLEMTQAEHAVTDAEQRALSEINTEHRRLEDAQARLRVAQLAQAAARETARVKVTQYQAQAALLADVLQSEAALADTDNQYRQALLAFWTAAAALEHAVGEE